MSSRPSTHTGGNLRFVAFVAALCLGLAVTAGAALAAGPPQPDERFGGDGRVALKVVESADDVSQSAWQVAVQPDGKVVAAVKVLGLNRRFAGSLVFLRFLPDGSLDPDFGDGGKRIVEFKRGLTAVPVELAIDSRGRAVTIANHSISLRPDLYPNLSRVVRLTPAGDLDRSFGDRGVANLDRSRLGGTVAAARLRADDSVDLAVVDRVRNRAVARTFHLSSRGRLRRDHGAGGARRFTISRDSRDGAVTAVFTRTALFVLGRRIDASTMRVTSCFVRAFSLASPRRSVAGIGDREELLAPPGQSVRTCAGLRPATGGGVYLWGGLRGSRYIAKIRQVGGDPLRAGWPMVFGPAVPRVRDVIELDDGRLALIGDRDGDGSMKRRVPTLSVIDSSGALDVSFGVGGSIDLPGGSGEPIDVATSSTGSAISLYSENESGGSAVNLMMLTR